MKILFLPNWDIQTLEKDNELIPSPDKQVCGEPYWFFRYFPEGTKVDIIDRQKQFLLHPFERRMKFYIYQSLKAFFRRKKYDVVISHGAQSGLVYSLLNIFSSRKKRPLHLIIDVGGLNGGRTSPLEIALIRLALKSQPAMICHASIQERQYKKFYNKEIVNARFIRFGANIDEFVLQNFPTKGYILSFGYATRDYDTLLKAWRQINTDKELVILGRAFNVEEKNVKVIGSVDVTLLRKYIAESLFVVMPLPVLNFSYGQMSLIHSMAMGKPLLVTRTPSTVDYIKDGEGAFFVNPEDADDMKSKLLFMLDNEANLNEWGVKARHYVEESLNEKGMAISIYKYIKELMPAGR